MRFKGKVAVVTGGNSGIGLSVAQSLVTEGAKVVIFGRDAATLEEAAKQLGENSHAVQGSVAEVADLERLFSETAELFGKVDILVANAGFAKARALGRVDDTFFREVAGTNYRGTYFTVQKALDTLNDGAAVVLVTTNACQLGMPGMSVYTSAKAAVRALARSFSAELLPRGIRVNALAPGAIDTPAYGRLGLPEEVVREFKQQLVEDTPVGRMGHTHEIARAALFLASDDASFITGVELVADGGMTQL